MLGSDWQIRAVITAGFVNPAGADGGETVVLTINKERKMEQINETTAGFVNPAGADGGETVVLTIKRRERWNKSMKS